MKDKHASAQGMTSLNQPVTSRRRPRVNIDPDAVGLREPGGDAVQPLGVAGHEHQVVTAAGELAGELEPDPCSGSGDQRGRHAG